MHLFLVRCQSTGDNSIATRVIFNRIKFCSKADIFFSSPNSSSLKILRFFSHSFKTVPMDCVQDFLVIRMPTTSKITLKSIGPTVLLNDSTFRKCSCKLDMGFLCLMQGVDQFAVSSKQLSITNSCW